MEPTQPTVADVIAILETIAPHTAAEPWDNAGLQVGNRTWPVRSIRVALDPAPDVVAAVCSEAVDLLITHHPLIFHPLSSVDFATPIGRIVQLAARHKLAVFSAHTNYDAANGGLNDVLAGKIGLVGLETLVPSEHDPVSGLGRVGRLADPMPLAGFARRIRDILGIGAVRYTGNPDKPVRRVAVCTGSGGSLLDVFLACGADVFVTGDVKYHEARTAEWAGTGIIDIGHFGSEHLMIDAIADRLKRVITAEKLAVDVAVCRIEKDPFTVI